MDFLTYPVHWCIEICDPPSSSEFNYCVNCLTFYLVLANRPILALLEYNLKVVNICEMRGIRNLEIVVL